MWSLHKMMAELWHKHKNGTATRDEIKELEMCLDANMNMVWKLARLENESLMASMVEDNDWQHEVCAKIDDFTEKLYS